jgi:hypothetical protein
MTTDGLARWALGLLLSSALLLGSIAVDASRRRREAARSDDAVLAVAARLPSSDLALSGGARWLRAPSLAEPSAAFDLGPAMLDPDPGGGLLSPPREVWPAEPLRILRGPGRSP